MRSLLFFQEVVLRFGLRIVSIVSLAAVLASSATAASADSAFVRVSPRDSRYFELSDGRPYIPIGLNLIAPDGATGAGETNGLARMDEWMGKLAANGGNYIRVWLSSPFWDVEAEHSGVYDETKARRIDAMLAMVRRHGLRVKLTLEHFREMSDNPRQRWANKPLHLVSRGGTATNVADFFQGAVSRERFQAKLAWFAKRYGNDPAIYGWELWNEVNAVAAGESAFLPWTEVMLQDLHRLFPRNLALQSLGSYDTARVRDLYRRHSLLRGNDVAQVHRYLDLGASLEVCHGPMDVLAADAVRDLISFDAKRPIILAESGAVEPRHTGPFKLYAKDKAGILLHDVLFAPFFAGAAGSGQIWHWDSYVDHNNLWFHFARFAAVVRDIDPASDGIRVLQLNHPRLRVYALVGKGTVLVWCRDSQNTWRSELEEGRAPETIEGVRLDMADIVKSAAPKGARAYDPWKDTWTDLKLERSLLKLPAFSRSIVVRLSL